MALTYETLMKHLWKERKIQYIWPPYI